MCEIVVNCPYLSATCTVRRQDTSDSYHRGQRRGREHLQSHIDRYARETGIECSVTRKISAFDLAGGDEAHYDLIFLNIELPGINGMEAAEAMREHDPETPIIFVTNLAQYAVHGYAVRAQNPLVMRFCRYRPLAAQ